MGSSVLLVLLIAASCVVAQNDGFQYMVNSMRDFQASDGGFGSRQGSDIGDLATTADASVLVALHGLASKVSVAGVTQFTQELENSDGGYAPSVGAASTISATLDAVVSLKNLDLTVSDAAKTASFVRSLFDESSGLFTSASGGGRGDIRSTAKALQTLDTIGHINSVAHLFPTLRDYLQKQVTGSHFAFVGAVTDSYWGVVVGSYVKFDFGSRVAPFVARYVSLAQPNGVAASESAAASLESSLHAAHAVHLLEGAVTNPVLLESLRAAIRNVPRSLRAAAQAHAISSLIGDISSAFRIVPSLERADGSPVASQVVQGSSFRAVVRVDNQFNAMGVGTSGATVTGKTTFSGTGGAQVTESTLVYNAERKVYVSPDLFETEDKLGVATLDFQVVRNVALYPPVKLSATLERSIGFGINVQASARQDATGRDIAEGEVVAVGTEFTFDVSLYRSDRKRFTSGDFDVAMVIQDSSRVTLHKEQLSGQTATELAFQYTLSSTNLPPGRLVFRFEVRPAGSASSAAHTVHEVAYQFSTHAVATHVTFPKTARLGQTATVSCVPAAFPDQRSVKPFGVGDRKFFLDLRTAKGNVISSVAGVSASNGKYTFDVKLDANLESLGTHYLSFRYQTADGKDFDLKAYNDATDEVIDDASSLHIAVETKLVLIDVVSMPDASKDFSFGNEVSLSFKIKDAISNQEVRPGAFAEGGPNVYLSLNHKDALQDYTSVSVPATYSATEHYEINWKITPNAARGTGTLVLSARGNDGADVPILQADQSGPVRMDVNVGGDIDVVSRTYSSKNPDTKRTLVAANFSLSCRGSPLESASLVATLRRGSVVVAEDLAVSSTSATAYEVSFHDKHASLPSGSYTLDVYRQVDRERLRELQAIYAQKRKEGVNVAEPTVTPLFSIALAHDGVIESDYPVAPEIVVTILLGVAFVFATRTLKQQ